MYKTKKKGKIKRFKNLKGKFIDLYIIQERQCLKIIIQNCDNLNRKLVVCFLFAFGLNIICYILNITSHQTAILVGFITTVIVIALCKTVEEENVVIVNGLGIQITIIYLLYTKAIFIPLERFQKIFISEVLLQRKVVCLLNLLIMDQNTKEKIIPLFMETIPRLNCLKIIYSTIVKSFNVNEHYLHSPNEVTNKLLNCNSMQ